MGTSVATDPIVLANRLRPVLLRLNRELRRELHELGVTAGQAALLAAVRAAPGIGVRDLAASERMSAPAMSGHLDRLEAAGLVRRVPVTDRRRVGLELTAEGERVLQTIRKRRTAWLAVRLRLLEPDELVAVDAAVEPLLRLLEADEQ